jgi:anti-sigma regulatory factor (Ser/Thr protein kinase)
VATAERVPWLRGQVRRVLDGVALDREVVALAVTEALTNVVRHAYPDRVGEALVGVDAAADGVVVSVRDFGVGGQGFSASPRSGLGLGLRLIRSLAEDVRIEPGAAGTLIVMRFLAVFDQPVGGS